MAQLSVLDKEGAVWLLGKLKEALSRKADVGSSSADSQKADDTLVLLAVADGVMLVDDADDEENTIAL
jgi:hypothetical protein